MKCDEIFSFVPCQHKKTIIRVFKQKIPPPPQQTTDPIDAEQ